MAKYQLFVLNHVSFSDVSPMEEKIFGALLTLRIKGYFKYHGHNVMPVDQHDHYCTHLLLCEETDGKYAPLACAKFIKYSDCEKYGFDFPPIDILERSNNKEALSRAKEMIHQACLRGEELSYDCSFTIAPEVRKSRKGGIVAKFILASWLCYHKHSQLNNIILSATVKTKTDRTFSRLGCLPICDDAYYDLYSINNERAQMMYFDDYSPQALKLIKYGCDIWESRMEIGNAITPCEKNVA